MALRRPSLSRSSLQRLSPLATSLGSRRHDPPISSRPTAGRRHMASATLPFGYELHTRGEHSLGEHAPNEFAPGEHTPGEHASGEFVASPEEQTGLSTLLRAIRRRDTAQICRSFIAWTSLLDSSQEDGAAPEVRNAAMRQAVEIPPTTFSEILRNIDPVLSPDQDVAHGINITWGHATLTDAGKLVDNFGVRIHHREVLAAVRVLLDIRHYGPHALLPHDYMAAMRCAGAAGDYQASKLFWTSMGTKLHQKSRSAEPWDEFLRSRFWLDPTYYQFDRTRVAVLARHLHGNRNPVPDSKLKKMDKIRFSMNALKREPWNRRRDEPSEDMMRLFRTRGDYRGFESHYRRGIAWGRMPDEKSLCASMIGFSRSSSVLSIVRLIFHDWYSITIEDPTLPISTRVLDRAEIEHERGSNKDEVSPAEQRASITTASFFPRLAAESPAETKTSEAETHIKISGGRDFPPSSSVKPTGLLLNAIVDAFGAMSHIALGKELLIYVSKRYKIPISDETWSNLLNWAYLCSSRPFATMRKIHGPYAGTTVKASDVRSVWDTMTSKPYNVKPTFEDYAIYIKTLLSQYKIKAALDTIREHAIPHYEAVADEHQTALCDELLQRDAGNLTLHATHRRQQAETRKDHVHHTIQSILHGLLKDLSRSGVNRRTNTTPILIPNLIAEFGEFFKSSVVYRIPNGEVKLMRPGTVRRFKVEQEVRETLPQNSGDAYAPVHVAGEAAPDYPQVDILKVKEWRRRPIQRMDDLPRVSGDPTKKYLWQRLENDMLL